MERWQTELTLKFRGLPWKMRVGFSFEWKAWLLAYELQGVTPGEFGKLDMNKQISAVIFGAACWDRMKKGKKIFFTFEDLDLALMGASKADNLRLVSAMNYAQFPDWLKEGMPEKEGVKKKEPSP